MARLPLLVVLLGLLAGFEAAVEEVSSTDASGMLRVRF